MTVAERKADMIRAATRRFLKHEINHHVWFSEGSGPNSQLFINYGYQSPSGVWERKALQIRLGNWRERRSLLPVLNKIHEATRALPWRALKEETALAKENKARRAFKKLDASRLEALLEE